MHPQGSLCPLLGQVSHRGLVVAACVERAVLVAGKDWDGATHSLIGAAGSGDFLQQKSRMGIPQ